MLTETLIDEMDFGVALKQSGKKIVGEIDEDNCYSQCYYELAKNLYDKFKEEELSLCHESCKDILAKVEQNLLRYLRVNIKECYPEPIFLLLKAYLDQKEITKAKMRLGYHISIIQSTKAHDPEWLEEVVHFIQKISLIPTEQFTQRLDSLLKRLEVNSRLCIEGRMKIGSEYFNNKGNQSNQS